MSDKSNLVSLLSILFILVVLVDTTLAAGRRDENPSEGHKYFVCTPKVGLLTYPSGRSIERNCVNGTNIACFRGDCRAKEEVLGQVVVCEVPVTLDFDKFTPDGGSLKFEKFRPSDRAGILVKQQYEIDRATGSYESIEHIMEEPIREAAGWTLIIRGHCEIVRKKLKY